MIERNIIDMEETEQTLTEEEKEQALDGIDHASGKEDELGQAEESSAEESIEKAENNETSAEDETKDEQNNLSPLEIAEEESAKLKDAWQRERAEFSNYRKRMMHEKSQIRAHASGVVIYDMLDALDNLDRVLLAKSDNAELNNFIEGVRMIKSQFLEVLKKHNVDTISPLDQEFVPTTMEAITTEEIEDIEKDTVIEVFQDGYVQNLEAGPHCLRPARVKVGKPPSSQNKEEKEDIK